VGVEKDARLGWNVLLAHSKPRCLLFFRISANQPLLVATLQAESSSSLGELTVPILSSWTQSFLQKVV